MAEQSNGCEWCGLSAEHERRICVFRDDTTYRMELDLNARPLSDETLSWIRTKVEEAAVTEPSIELTIKHIGNQQKQVKGAKT